MSVLAPLLAAHRATLSSTAPSGVAATGLPGVTFFWIDHDTPRSPLLYDTGIVVVGQGHKEGFLGGRRFRYDADSCLVLGVPVPFECASYGTPEEPLLGVRLDIDVALVHSLVARASLPVDPPNAVHSAVEPLNLDGPLLAAVARLLQSLRDPVDRTVVGPAAVEEIVYRILRSEHGRVLHALTRQQTPYANIAAALEHIHRDYASALSVEDLARKAAMGVSSFHRTFKEAAPAAEDGEPRPHASQRPRRLHHLGRHYAERAEGRPADRGLRRGAAHARVRGEVRNAGRHSCAVCTRAPSGREPNHGPSFGDCELVLRATRHYPFGNRGPARCRPHRRGGEPCRCFTPSRTWSVPCGRLARAHGVHLPPPRRTSRRDRLRRPGCPGRGRRGRDRGAVERGRPRPAHVPPWHRLHRRVPGLPARRPDRRPRVSAHTARLHRMIGRLDALAADAKPSVALTSSDLLAPIAAFGAMVPALATVRWCATDEVQPAERLPPVRGDIAFLQYTSGSTSTPRGVVLGHDTLLLSREPSGASGRTADTRGVFWLPPYHDMGLIRASSSPSTRGTRRR
ncbi:MAG: AraC family transcriptional regulator N-terminal domain-containing protein [Myxococcota bacterium]